MTHPSSIILETERLRLRELQQSDFAEFSRLGASTVISLIRPANLPSRAVAERNGMTIDKTTTFRTFETLVYRVRA